MENTTENYAVKPETQCAKLYLYKVTSNNNENTNKTASLPRIRDVTNQMSKTKTKES